MTRIRCAATMSMGMEKAAAGIMEKADVGIIADRMSGIFFKGIRGLLPDAFLSIDRGGLEGWEKSCMHCINLIRWEKKHGKIVKNKGGAV